MKNLTMYLTNERCVKVDSLEHASKTWNTFREYFGIRSSTMARNAGKIFNRDTGEQVAYVSYNGKVWKGKEEDSQQSHHLLLESQGYLEREKK